MQGRIQGGADSPPPKTYESNFIRHDFAQTRKSIRDIRRFCHPFVLSQQCCEVNFISLTVVNPRMRLDYQI